MIPRTHKLYITLVVRRSNFRQIWSLVGPRRGPHHALLNRTTRMTAMVRAMKEPPTAISPTEGPFSADEPAPAWAPVGWPNKSWKKWVILSMTSITVFFALSTKSAKGEAVGAFSEVASSNFSGDSTVATSSGNVWTRVATQEKTKNGHTCCRDDDYDVVTLAKELWGTYLSGESCKIP